MAHRVVFVDDLNGAWKQLSGAIARWSKESHRENRQWEFHLVRGDSLGHLQQELAKGAFDRPPNVHRGALIVSLDAMIPGVRGCGIWDQFAPQNLWNGTDGPQFGALALHSVAFAGHPVDYPGHASFAASQLKVAESFRAARDDALKNRIPGTPPAHSHEAHKEFRHVFRCGWVRGIDPAVNDQTAFAEWANYLADLVDNVAPNSTPNLIGYYV